MCFSEHTGTLRVRLCVRLSFPPLGQLDATIPLSLTDLDRIHDWFGLHTRFFETLPNETDTCALS